MALAIVIIISIKTTELKKKEKIKPSNETKPTDLLICNKFNSNVCFFLRNSHALPLVANIEKQITQYDEPLQFSVSNNAATTNFDKNHPS